MKLARKTLLFFVSIMALLVVVLTVLSTYSFYRFSLYTAERHARSVAEIIKVGLTESMINGTIAKRPQFLGRLDGVPGVRAVRVVRGPAVAAQYGPGLAQEVPGAAEMRVLESGEASMATLANGSGRMFRAIIPYSALEQGAPNCLQCHAVPAGTPLGVVTIDISLDEVRQQAMTAVALITLSVFLAVVLALLLLRWLLRPLALTARAVQAVTQQAIGGNFGHRIGERTSDEMGEIADNINRLMDFLEREVGTIRRRVGELMGHHQAAADAGNELVHTTEMVEGLVEAAKFKQAIEEDQNKLDIYRRLGDVLSRQYDFHRFSIYEVAASKNRMTPVIVDGEADADCRWCDPQVLLDASCCRVRRTGREVNAVDAPGLCTMFRPHAGEGDTHICLPINQSGTAGCVVQIVMAEDEAQLGKCLVPFVDAYLREAGPVLEAKRLMEDLRENSMRDALTGLYNRRFLEEYVSQLVSGSQRRKSPFSVLMLDLDYFKQVNDSHGHEAGDKVLKTLAEVMAHSLRASDMVVRYGGEEFLIVLRDTGAEAAVHVAEKIREHVATTKIALPEIVLQETVTIGVAEFPGDSDTFWQVAKFADIALYEAKAAGRNRVMRFLPQMWDGSEHG
jgi:diguanylate cyclase (GGDEF)-like protein